MAARMSVRLGGIAFVSVVLIVVVVVVVAVVSDSAGTKSTDVSSRRRPSSDMDADSFRTSMAKFQGDNRERMNVRRKLWGFFLARRFKRFERLGRNAIKWKWDGLQSAGLV